MVAAQFVILVLFVIVIDGSESITITNKTKITSLRRAHLHI